MIKNKELKKLIKLHKVNENGIEFLLDYYRKNLKWGDEKAISYIISLFENGTIDEIKVLGGENNGKGYK